MNKYDNESKMARALQLKEYLPAMKIGEVGVINLPVVLALLRLESTEADLSGIKDEDLARFEKVAKDHANLHS